jgi:tRNA nucleotidyltransferase (CCA-adding enzyme)
MDSSGNIIDLLHAKDDLDAKIIKMVGNSRQRLKEDILRVLRAIRFATLLNFTIADDVKKAIIKNGKFLKNLSYTRKKEELTKIFTSSNITYGLSLLTELRLDKHLQLSHLSDLVIVDDILGIWAQLDVLEIYPFSKVERETIAMVMEALKLSDIDNKALYKYGLYVMSIVASIKGISKSYLNNIYVNMPIKSRSDIALDVNYLCHQLNIKPGSWLKDIYSLLEDNILNGNLKNDKDEVHIYVTKYLEDNLLVK